MPMRKGVCQKKQPTKKIGEQTVEERLVAESLAAIDFKNIPSNAYTGKNTDPEEPFKVVDGSLAEPTSSIYEETIEIGRQLDSALEKEDLDDIAEQFRQLEIKSAEMLGSIDAYNKEKYSHVAAEFKHAYNNSHLQVRREAFLPVSTKPLTLQERLRLLGDRIFVYPKKIFELDENQLDEIFEYFVVYTYIKGAEMDKFEEDLSQDCDLFKRGYFEGAPEDELQCTCIANTVLMGESEPWNPVYFAVANGYTEFLKQFSKLAVRNSHVGMLLRTYVKQHTKLLIELAMINDPPDNETLRILLSTNYMYCRYLLCPEKLANFYFSSQEEILILPEYRRGIFSNDYYAQESRYTERFLSLCLAHGHKNIFLEIFSLFKVGSEYMNIIRKDIPRILLEAVRTNELDFIEYFFMNLLAPFFEDYYKDNNMCDNFLKILFLDCESPHPETIDTFVHEAVRSYDPKLLETVLGLLENILNTLRKLNEKFPRLPIEQVRNIDELNPIELAVELHIPEMVGIFEKYGYTISEETRERMRLYRSIVNKEENVVEFVRELCSRPNLPAAASLLSLLITILNDDLAYEMLQYYNLQGFKVAQKKDLNRALLCALYPDRHFTELAKLKNEVTEKTQKMMARVGMLLMAGAEFKNFISHANISERVPEMIVRFVKDVHQKRLTNKFPVAIYHPDLCPEVMFDHFELNADDY